MKQQNLKEPRNYKLNPRTSIEPRDSQYTGAVAFTEEDYDKNPTKQSEAEACDINNIMKKYQATGFIPEFDRTPINFDHLSYSETYHEAMNIVANANSQFFAMPAEIRAQFANNPHKFLEFCENPENSQKLVEMGLAEVKKAPEPTERELLKELAENTRPKKTKQQAASTASTEEG